MGAELLLEQLDVALEQGTLQDTDLKRVVNDLKQRQHAFDALVQVAQEVSRVASAADLKELINYILDHALSLVGAERGMLVLREESGTKFKLAGVRHLDKDDTESVQLSQSLIRRVLETGETVVTTNAAEDPRFVAKDSIVTYAIRSVLAVPLETLGGVMGALYLDTRVMTRVFSQDDVPVMSAFAGITSSALELVRSLESRKDLFLESVRALVNAVEAKDPYTAGHSSRVGLYAQGILRAITKNEVFAEQALIAGYLHDVGKIGISDAHVSKSGPLSDEEWAEFKQHTVIGEKILKSANALSDILPAVRSHHEKLDGTGYPDGLHGAEIPFLAKVICVADCFDAMTTDRPYRKSPGKDYALSELKKYSGTQFDPVIVDAFHRAFKEGMVNYMGIG